MSSLAPAQAVALPEGARVEFPLPSPELEAAVRALQVVPSYERRHLVRHDAAVVLDGLLARVARSRGALDIGLAEVLAALAEGDRTLRLGFSSIGDYARHRLGIAPRTAQGLVRLGKGLASRPLLRAAVRAGLVSQRAAQVVLPVACGDVEAAWVALAREKTVRELAQAVKAARADAGAGNAGGAGATDGACSADGAGPAAGADAAGAEGTAPADGDAGGRGLDDVEEGEAWQPVSLPVSAEARKALDDALEVGGRALGHGAPLWQRLEGLAQEYLGAFPSEAADAPHVGALLASWRGGLHGTWSSGAEVAAAPGWRAEYEAFLEAESGRWAWLEAVAPVAAPAVETSASPRALDASLQRLASLRGRWDGLLGHLGLLARGLGLWREAGFASFSQYCRERLGLSVRAVEGRIALERKLYAFPPVRQALDDGTLSPEQARLVTRVANPHTAEGWVARAAARPCLTLQREVEALDSGQGDLVPPPWEAVIPPAFPHAGQPTPTAQPCAPSPTFRARVPMPVAALLASALASARRQLGQGRQVTESDCLQAVAAHFLSVWGALPRGRSTPQRRALRRDGHRCQAPGCSRAAAHAHHLRFRSQGGGDQLWNLTSLCAAHHLHALHLGWLRVQGTAPDGLRWELGDSDPREVWGPPG